MQIASDSELIHKMYTQLLENAFKFTEKGSVRAGFFIKDDRFHGYVEDTGIGIDEDLQNEIFKVFVQEDNSSTREYEGSGLGLSIVKGIARLLGGNVKIHSKKGKGTKVTFDVPVEFKNQTPQDKLMGNLTKKDTVLIVEDDRTHRIYLRKILQRKGLTILEAQNGEEGVEFCKTDENIKLVFMDIRMPGMDGYHATKEIKRVRPELPVIAVTAYAMTGDEQLALKAGCDSYIEKPVSKKQLFEFLRTLGLD